MNPKFEIDFLEETREFLLSLNEKARGKLIYNIDKAKQHNDPKLFKKLNGDIWEFRAESMKLQYRLLAFWDKRNGKKTLVIYTHGFIKNKIKFQLEKLKKLKK